MAIDIATRKQIIEDNRTHDSDSGSPEVQVALLTAEIFGFVSLGSVLGMMTLMTQIGSGFGPFLVGWAEDSTGSYRMPFVVTGVATMAAALLILLARPISVVAGPASSSPVSSSTVGSHHAV